eukprot:872226-Prorocentrum_minimum.AAC.2
MLRRRPKRCYAMGEFRFRFVAGWLVGLSPGSRGRGGTARRGSSARTRSPSWATWRAAPPLGMGPARPSAADATGR